ncbi:protein NRT1/ PTR FAMILY 8.3-like [Panicum miliaceum]|uniref:Protein NRT1/ PTR FAMILY 8.3-like n=1 Tax=Panicum miliaceum TaxID=4540 RepID=A0A3L6QBN2_PANMI|nr:protein NRT1/ PTR FAMILY 8.3-like [Panicum miliaceum]
MDAGDAMERGQRSPRLPENRNPKIQDESLTVPLIHDKKSGSKAPAIVLDAALRLVDF